MKEVKLLGTRYYVVDQRGNRLFGSKNKAEADAYLAKHQIEVVKAETVEKISTPKKRKRKTKKVEE
jgi:hypothetical protein